MSECRRIQADLAGLAGLEGLEGLEGLVDQQHVSDPRRPSPAQRARLAHAASCPSCGPALAALRVARGIVRVATAEVEPSPGFASRVMAAVQAQSRPAAAAPDPWRPAWALLPVFGLVAAALMIALLQSGTSTGGDAATAWALLGESRSPSARLLLTTGSPEPDLVLAAVLEDGGR